MDRNIVKTNNAPEAIGPYSQGIKSSGFIFTSGQIPLNPKTGLLIKGDFKSETIQVLNNLDEILKDGGSSIELAIKLTVYLVEISDFPLLNEIFDKYFTDNPPARTTIQVAALPMNARIEIDAIGLIN